MRARTGVILLAAALFPATARAQARESVRVGFTVPVVVDLPIPRHRVSFSVPADGTWTSGPTVVLEHRGNVDQAVALARVALVDGPGHLDDLDVEVRVEGGAWQAARPPVRWPLEPGVRTGALNVESRVRRARPGDGRSAWTLEFGFMNAPAGD